MVLNCIRLLQMPLRDLRLSLPTLHLTLPMLYIHPLYIQISSRQMTGRCPPTLKVSLIMDRNGHGGRVFGILKCPCKTFLSNLTRHGFLRG